MTNLSGVFGRVVVEPSVEVAVLVVPQVGSHLLQHLGSVAGAHCRPGLRGYFWGHKRRLRTQRCLFQGALPFPDESNKAVLFSDPKWAFVVDDFVIGDYVNSFHFQDLYSSLSSTLIYTTSISQFNANSSKKFQTATLNQ